MGMAEGGVTRDQVRGDAAIQVPMSLGMPAAVTADVTQSGSLTFRRAEKCHTLLA